MSADAHHLVHARTQPLLAPCDRADPVLAAGKRHNVTEAARRLDGLLLEPGERVSLLGHLQGGAHRPFVPGWSPSSGEPYAEDGGGLSLVSQALFELAVRTGARIVEQHPARFELAGSPLPVLDARIALPARDLVFVPAVALRLVVAVRGHGFVVAAYAEGALPFEVSLEKIDEVRTPIMHDYAVVRTIRDARGLVEHGVVARVRRLVLGGEPTLRAA